MKFTVAFIHISTIIWVSRCAAVIGSELLNETGGSTKEATTTPTTILLTISTVASNSTGALLSENSTLTVDEGDAESGKSTSPLVMGFLAWKEHFETNPLPDKGLLGALYDKDAFGNNPAIFDKPGFGYNSNSPPDDKYAMAKPILAPDLKKAYVLLILQDALLNRWIPQQKLNTIDKTSFRGQIISQPLADKYTKG